MSDYPEHDKLQAVREQSQAIGEFIDMGPYTLCTFREAGNNGESEYVWTAEHLKRHPEDADNEPTLRDHLARRAKDNPARDSWGSGFIPVGKPIEHVLAEWFEIDLDKVEAEKRAMLDALRAANT